MSKLAIDFDGDSFESALGSEAYTALMQSLHDDIVARQVVADSITRQALKAWEDSPLNVQIQDGAALGLGSSMGFAIEHSIDAQDYLAWCQAEGSIDCWEDPDFLDYQDKTVGIRVRRNQSRNSIIVPATKYTRITR
jgi:hypothetical protein